MPVCARLAAVAIVALIHTLPATASAQPVAYVVDPKHAEVRFSYTMPMSDGVGRFSTVTGTANIDDAAPEKTTVEAVVDTRTLRASTSMAQSELRGADFFDVARYPTMAFKSRSVRPKTPTTGEMTGDITVKGITRPIVLRVTLQPPGPDGAREFRGLTRINRNDFNMTAYALLVGETVDIEIRTTLRPAQ
jgi:polyisoprenoid-binding protein YceI